jgi:hypothetical protein
MSATVAQDAANAEAKVQAVVSSTVTQFQSDLDFVKANWLKVNLIVIAAGVVGFLVGQIVRI